MHLKMKYERTAKMTYLKSLFHQVGSRKKRRIPFFNMVVSIKIVF